MLRQIFLGNISWDKEEFLSLCLVFLEKFIEIFPTFWHFALFAVEKNPVTVGKLIIGLSFLIGGYITIRLFVTYFERRVLSHLDIEIPKKYTIKVLLFYFLVSLLFLFTLYLVQIPLTVFTLLGGAIALGIGFGAKNIMNNFISGIVIVIEHPIRVGDLIELENLSGIVEHIGFRATNVTTLNNTHVMIPNSFLLEKNVLNWTLSDKVVRSEIEVGVVYGSEVEKVRKILLEVAESHDRVLTYNPDQKPVVLFSDFGENSLVFALSYWIAVEKIFDIRRVASELRFKISKKFNEDDVAIAFPQRDLHIKEPVQVAIQAQK